MSSSTGRKCLSNDQGVPSIRIIDDKSEFPTVTVSEAPGQTETLGTSRDPSLLEKPFTHVHYPDSTTTDTPNGQFRTPQIIIDDDTSLGSTTSRGLGAPHPGNRGKSLSAADDYDRKFPEDAHAQEMGSNARVYKVYLEEASKFNCEMADNWGNSLDVLLIFAGLFSAVVGTLVVEASGNLRRDFAEMNANLQEEANALLRASLSGLSATSVPITSPSPKDRFVPDSKTVWVNGLWFISLSLSLTAAFFAVLAKQWLKHYLSFIPGSPQTRARTMEARRRSSEDWQLTNVIAMLPVIMHISLFIFFVGLALFPDNNTISNILIGIVSLTGLFYVITTILPLYFPRCSFVTPLTIALHTLIRIWVVLAQNASSYIKHTFFEDRSQLWPKNKANFASLKESLNYRPHLYEERDAALEDVDQVDADILDWLHSAALLNPSIQPIVCDAIAGLPDDFGHVTRVRNFAQGMHDDWPAEISHLLRVQKHQRAERYIRVIRFFGPPILQLNSGIHWLGAILQIRIRGETLQQRLHGATFTCCDLSLGHHSYWEYDHWIHAMMAICLPSLSSSGSSRELPKLHPRTWETVFATIVQLVQVPWRGGSARKCASLGMPKMLREVLNHYYKKDRKRPYFNGPPSNQRPEHKRTTVVATIVELPPGQSRGRLLHLAYALCCKKPNEDGYLPYLAFMIDLSRRWQELLIHLAKPSNHIDEQLNPADLRGIFHELAHTIDFNLQISSVDGPERKDTDASGIGIVASMADFRNLAVGNLHTKISHKVIRLARVVELGCNPLHIPHLLRISEKLMRSDIRSKKGISPELKETVQGLLQRILDSILSPSEEQLATLGTTYELLAHLLASAWSHAFTEGDGIKMVLKKLPKEDSEDASHTLVFSANIIRSLTRGAVVEQQLGTNDSWIGLLNNPQNMKELCTLMIRARYHLLVYRSLKHDRSTNSKFLDRFGHIHHLDEWWKDMLELTKQDPSRFKPGWEIAFKTQLLQPQRPYPDEQRSTQESEATELWLTQWKKGRKGVALYNKAHYRWAEALKDALDVDGSDETFSLRVEMNHAEKNSLPFNFRLLVDKVQDTGSTHYPITIEYKLIEEYLDENLNITTSGNKILSWLNRSIARIDAGSSDSVSDAEAV